ncbi:MAG: ABC transporter substrate-binding protein [Solibacillus sp.]|uniref:ABC transporter substrate-binding protein n=1 Tax=unclassified Solibacillus TaxID=2637870 RepID=UPI0030FCC913
MITLKKVRILAPIIVVAGLLGACGSEKDVTSSNVKGKYEITVGLSQSAGGTLVDIAHQEGYFKDEDLTVNRVGFANSADGLNALQAGKVDVGVSFGTAGPLTFIANGSDFSIIGGHLEGGHPILTKKENAEQYTSLEDYKGKKVGTIRIFTSDIVFRSALEKAGIDWENEVEIVEFKTGSMLLEAVASGKVDVAVSANSFYAQAVDMGLEAVAWSNDLQDGHVCCRVVTRSELLTDEDGEAYKRFLKALIRAERKKVEDPQAAVTAAKEYMKVDDNVINKIVNEGHSNYSSDPSKEKVATMWEQMKEIGYVENVDDININDYVNIDLYERALNELIEENPEDQYYAKQLVRFNEQNI